MPIVFIVSGLILICMIFRVVSTKSSILNFLIMFILASIVLSYMLPDVILGRIKFDVLLCFALGILFVLLLLTCKFSVWDIVLVLLSAIAFKLLLDNNLNFLVSYNSSLAIGLIVVVSLFYLNSLFKGIQYILLTSLMVLFISTNADLINLNFSVIDLNFVFHVLIIYFSIFILFNSIRYFLNYNLRIFYEKKKTNDFK